MALVGDVLLETTSAARINYEMLGNLEPALHAHLFPRYDTEPPELRTRPIWFYDWSQAAAFDSQRQASFVQAVREGLEKRGVR